MYVNQNQRQRHAAATLIIRAVPKMISVRCAVFIEERMADHSWGVVGRFSSFDAEALHFPLVANQQLAVR